MSLDDFIISLELEMEDILSSDFNIIVKETDVVPNIDDPEITYPNTDTMQQKCKLIETCVLYIDIRNSTDLNLAHRRETMAKLYSSFVRSMLRAGSHYGGKVRNIIGDRLMVLFDKQDCYKKAVDTAVLMNSVSKYILNKHFKHNEFSCGIGIDYGKMLVTKGGIVKYGIERANYKSLVWLGRPANIASKLTDLANKETTNNKSYVQMATSNGFLSPWNWEDTSLKNFISQLEVTPYKLLKHKNQNFSSFILSEDNNVSSTPAILMTKEVYDGYKKVATELQIDLYHEIPQVKVKSYTGKIYGGSVIFTAFLKK